ADDFQSIQQRGPGDDGRTMLIVVENWNLHGLAQSFLDVETFRGFNVLEVDTAEGEFEKLADLDDLVRIVRIEFDVEHIHVGESLEQHRLPFHNRLASQSADVAEAQDRGSVGHDGNQVTAPGVIESVVGILVDGETRLRHAGRVGQAEVALSTAGLGGSDFDFSGLGAAVIIQSLLFGDHYFLRDLFLLPAPGFRWPGSIPSGSAATQGRSGSSGEPLSGSSRSATGARL